MKSPKHILILAAAFCGLASSAETTQASPNEVTGGGIVIPLAPPRRFELTPQLSVVSLTGLNLPGAGYNVSYLPQFEGLPTFQLTLGRPIGELRRLTFTLQASAGYGARNGNYNVTTLATGLSQPQNITLRWVPTTLSTRISLRMPEFSSVRPSLTFGVGSLFLFQESPFAALNRTMAVPMISISPQITFQDITAIHWLGGFSFGATFIRGLSPSVSLAASSWDLSFYFLL